MINKNTITIELTLEELYQLRQKLQGVIERIDCIPQDAEKSSFQKILGEELFNQLLGHCYPNKEKEKHENRI
jgi:hypothetical protein